MSIITSIASALTKAVRSVTAPIVKGISSVLTRSVQYGMKREGYTFRDIVDTIQHSGVESIAAKLNQSTFTVSRLLDTEPLVLSSDYSKLLPRNLIVSGELKSGRNYRYFYQADVIDSSGRFVTRKWFSLYADTQKAFSEVKDDIEDSIAGGNYDTTFTVTNITFHHVMHQRGAPFLPVNPR